METVILQQDHHHRRVIWSAPSNKLACGICERVFVLNKLEFNLIALFETCYVFSNKLIKLVFLCSRPASIRLKKPGTVNSLYNHIVETG